MMMIVFWCMDCEEINVLEGTSNGETRSNIVLFDNSFKLLFYLFYFCKRAFFFLSVEHKINNNVWLEFTIGVSYIHPTQFLIFETTSVVFCLHCF
ncbi:hypothetical protein HanIR_Chr16g0807591 [Helianthus annuus]|nr:hypothetical protein HanIR_Chr16g0807591 [Helianthus annuus]